MHCALSVIFIHCTLAVILMHCALSVIVSSMSLKLQPEVFSGLCKSWLGACSFPAYLVKKLLVVPQPTSQPPIVPYGAAPHTSKGPLEPAGGLCSGWEIFDKDQSESGALALELSETLWQTGCTFLQPGPLEPVCMHITPRLEKTTPATCLKVSSDSSCGALGVSLGPAG